MAYCSSVTREEHTHSFSTALAPCGQSKVVLRQHGHFTAYPFQLTSLQGSLLALKPGRIHVLSPLSFGVSEFFAFGSLHFMVNAHLLLLSQEVQLGALHR